VHEMTVAESVIGEAVALRIGTRRKKFQRRHKPKKLAGDKGYSCSVSTLIDWRQSSDCE